MPSDCSVHSNPEISSVLYSGRAPCVFFLVFYLSIMEYLNLKPVTMQLNTIRIVKTRILLVEKYLIETINPEIATSVEFIKHITILAKVAL